MCQVRWYVVRYWSARVRPDNLTKSWSGRWKVDFGRCVNFLVFEWVGRLELRQSVERVSRCLKKSKLASKGSKRTMRRSKNWKRQAPPIAATQRYKLTTQYVFCSFQLFNRTQRQLFPKKNGLTDDCVGGWLVVGGAWQLKRGRDPTEKRGDASPCNKCLEVILTKWIIRRDIQWSDRGWYEGRTQFLTVVMRWII